MLAHSAMVSGAVSLVVQSGGAQEQLFWNICSLSVFLGLSLGTTPSLQLLQVSAALSAIYSNFL